MTDKIGVITHYYDKIGVAVVKVLKSFSVGDKIKISGHDSEFEQEICSMQMDYKEIKKAKKGESVGMKVDQLVHEHDTVYKTV